MELLDLRRGGILYDEGIEEISEGGPFFI